MSRDKKGNVAYFVAKWHLHQQASEGALMFAEEGYSVDVFLYRASRQLCDLEPHPNINIIDFSEHDEEVSIPGIQDSGNMFGKLYQRVLKQGKCIVFGTGKLAEGLLRILPVKAECFIDNNSLKWNSTFLNTPVYSPDTLRSGRPDDLPIIVASSYYDEISAQLREMGYLKNVDFFYGRDLLDAYYFQEVVLPKSREIVKQKEYNAFIGVEKLGLIWAGMLAEEKQTPYLYHSLELYTSDHPNWLNKDTGLRKKEMHYHQNATATIVQDHAREHVLFKDHGIRQGRSFYVPVSISNFETNGDSGDFFHKKFGISKEKKILLLLTMFMPGRFCEELVQCAQGLPDEYQVVIHGPANKAEYLQSVVELDLNKKVVFSTEVVDHKMLQNLIAEAYIGLAFYRRLPLNDQLTIFSSDKIARYLQCGIPFLTFDYPTNQKFIRETQCGQCIKGFDELISNVELISNEYEVYSQNAKEAFEKFYDFSKNYRKVVDFINGYK
ncbi:MAG: hypothetical protein E6Y08_07215 [Paenibacillus sp.]|uniref:hypothetical protein n=1 Tax=Paenibacillus sp. TaxID=58172 RepID=UPI00290F9269|nr:hypothetical protein [Paenibacillus sp.]MDU4695588.1 hypothetical protein [Paenibacillus sp.]